MKRILIGVALIGFLGSVANAAVSAGKNEVQFSGSYDNVKVKDNGHDEGGNVKVEVGHFFTDALEFSLLGGGTWTDSTDLYRGGVAGRWHFLTDGNIVPYVGAFGAYGYADSDTGSDDGWSYGPLGGVRFFVAENVNIFLEYQWQEFDGDIGDNIDEQQVVFAGISFLF